MLRNENSNRYDYILKDVVFISDIIKPGEITFIKGKPGGAFIALKREMIDRAERKIKKK